MARSLSGNLIGKAARDEAADLREMLRSNAEKCEKAKHLTRSQVMDVCQELADIMEGKYERWWTLTPAMHFGDAAVAKLLALKSLVSDDPRTPAQKESDAQDADWQAQVSELRG